MKSNKKKIFSWFKPIPFLAVMILGLMISVSLFLVKKPEVLAATYAKEDINLGIYKFGLYYPSGTNQNAAPYPVIIINHGMSAQYSYYAWFAEAMANKGYIVAMPNRMIPGVNMEEGKRLNNFLLAYLSSKNRFTTSLKGKVDLTKVGIAGHSMGADVALFSAGVSNLKAVLAIAPADKSTGAMKLVSGLTTNLLLGKYIEKSMNKIYSNISSTSVPIMYLTGSLDSLVTPEASKTLYGLTTQAKKALLILNGANHVQFSPTGSTAGDAVAASLDKRPTMAASKVLETTITYGGAWFDYFLKGDQAAKKILDNGGQLSPDVFSIYETNYSSTPLQPTSQPPQPTSQPPQPTSQPPQPTSQPPQACVSGGYDIALVIDNSGSVSLYLAQMLIDINSFVDAFSGKSTKFSVIKFSDTANILVSGFTDDLAMIKNKISSITGGGTTNWQDALIKAKTTLDSTSNRPSNPDLVIFASDGNPNTTGPNGGTSGGDPLTSAVTVADAIKASGARIITLGIGNGINEKNLRKISGSIPGVDGVIGADVILTNFDTLAANLAKLAVGICE